MFDPMFVSQPAFFFGIPAGIIPILVGFAGLVVGFLWVRRLVDLDPEAPLFARYPRTRPWQRDWVMAVGVIAVVAIGSAMVLKA